MKKRTTELFIFLFTAMAFSYFSQANAGTCSSISRSSFGSNTVLTSAELNTQFSTVYGATNNLDAGCLTDGTLEAAALNATEFSPILNNVVAGCEVSRSSVSAVSISPCTMSINGNMLTKTGATVVSMGCGDCSAETASTKYYVYVKGDSTGSTLNAFLSTTAPDSFGNNGTARVIARIKNDSSSNIIEYGIDQWKINNFVPTETGWVNGGTVTIEGVVTDPTKAGGIYTDSTDWIRHGSEAKISLQFQQSNATGTAGSGDYLFTLPSGLQFSDDVVVETNSVPFSSVADKYSGINLSIYDAGTGFFCHGTGVVIPYDRTRYRIYSIVAYCTGGTNLSAFRISSSAWRMDEAVNYVGTFMAPIDGFY